RLKQYDRTGIVPKTPLGCWEVLTRILMFIIQRSGLIHMVWQVGLVTKGNRVNLIFMLGQMDRVQPYHQRGTVI
ncbi:hypothetical protein, partial [Xenorhabdus griffiniae]|uniref:hypothetical protein n=1 Tax=Xenorhabdus griffiniae TaxID=351672 RepID=UPI001CB8983C